MKAVRTGNWSFAHLLALNAECHAEVAYSRFCAEIDGRAREDDDGVDAERLIVPAKNMRCQSVVDAAVKSSFAT